MSIQEFSIRVPKNSKKKYNVMRFNATLNVDFEKWGDTKMRRENNMNEYKRMDEEMPKFGAGSEFGRDAREEARRKKFGINTNQYKPNNQPWILESVDINGKISKKFKGIREGGISENTSYYVFTHAPDGAIEAFPLQEWYNFQPIQRYKTLSAEEAEHEFSRGAKTLNYYNLMVRHRCKNEQDGNEDTEGGLVSENGKNIKTTKFEKDFKISDMDELMSDNDDDDDDDDDDDGSGSGDEKKHKNSDDGDDKFGDKKKKKRKGKQKKKKKTSDDEAFEDSDDGDEEGRELDYISDSSDSEPEKEQFKQYKGVSDEVGLRRLIGSDDEDEDEENNKIDPVIDEDEEEDDDDDDDDDVDNDNNDDNTKNKTDVGKNNFVSGTSCSTTSFSTTTTTTTTTTTNNNNTTTTTTTNFNNTNTANATGSGSSAGAGGSVIKDGDKKKDNKKKKNKKNSKKKDIKKPGGKESSSDSDTDPEISTLKEKQKEKDNKKINNTQNSRSATPIIPGQLSTTTVTTTTAAAITTATTATKAAAATTTTTTSNDSHKRKHSNLSETSLQAKKAKTDHNNTSTISPPLSMSAVNTSIISGLSDSGISEEAVRRYLARKPMTTTELLQKFKSKKTGLSSDQLVNIMTQILKKINPTKQVIQGKMYLSLK